MKGTVKSRYAIENLSSEEVEGVRQLNLTEYIQGSSDHTHSALKKENHKCNNNCIFALLFTFFEFLSFIFHTFSFG